MVGVKDQEKKAASRRHQTAACGFSAVSSGSMRKKYVRSCFEAIEVKAGGFAGGDEKRGQIGRLNS